MSEKSKSIAACLRATAREVARLERLEFLLAMDRLESVLSKPNELPDSVPANEAETASPHGAVVHLRRLVESLDCYLALVGEGTESEMDANWAMCAELDDARDFLDGMGGNCHD